MFSSYRCHPFAAAAAAAEAAAGAVAEAGAGAGAAAATAAAAAAVVAAVVAAVAVGDERFFFGHLDGLRVLKVSWVGAAAWIAVVTVWDCSFSGGETTPK